MRFFLSVRESFVRTRRVLPVLSFVRFVRDFHKIRYFLGLFGLVELLRINILDHEERKQRFYLLKYDIARCVKAGRMLAAQCKADVSKPCYGLEEMPSIQETLDRLYPGDFGLEVWECHSRPNYNCIGIDDHGCRCQEIRKVFGDEMDRKFMISLLAVPIGNNKMDFFGLRKNPAKRLNKRLKRLRMKHFTGKMMPVSMH